MTQNNTSGKFHESILTVAFISAMGRGIHNRHAASTPPSEHLQVYQRSFPGFRDAVNSPDATSSHLELLTVDEVAAMLRSSVVTIRRRVKRGDIPAFRLMNSGPWLFRKDDVLRQLTPVGVSSAPPNHPPGLRSCLQPTVVGWGADLAGSTHQKENHGS